MSNRPFFGAFKDFLRVHFLFKMIIWTSQVTFNKCPSMVNLLKPWPFKISDRCHLNLLTLSFPSFGKKFIAYMMKLHQVLLSYELPRNHIQYLRLQCFPYDYLMKEYCKSRLPISLSPILFVDMGCLISSTHS